MEKVVSIIIIVIIVAFIIWRLVRPYIQPLMPSQRRDDVESIEEEKVMSTKSRIRNIQPEAINGVEKGTEGVGSVERENKHQALMGILYGFLWLIGGGAVTFLSLYFASEGWLGGFFVITWGAVLYGIIIIIKNLVALIRYYYTKNLWEDVRGE